MNLKRIKDSAIDKVAKLLGMLAEQPKVEDSANLDCDDLLLGASISNLSDADVVIMWETSYATDAEKKEFMDFMSDRLDLPESLDDFVYDYAIHCQVDMDTVLALLNEWVPKEVKKEMCAAFVDMSKIDDSKKVEDSVDETLNTYRRLTQLFEAEDWGEFDKVWSGCSEDCKKIIIENSEDDPDEFKARLK